MKTLPTQYRKNGYDHEIIYRDTSYVISRLTSSGTNKFICLEVFKVKIQKPSQLFGNYTEDTETTPSNEEWGTDGFTVYTMEQALEKIEWLKRSKKPGRKYSLKN